MLYFHIQLLDLSKSHGQVCSTVGAGEDEMVESSSLTGKAENRRDNKTIHIISNIVPSIVFFPLSHIM